MTGDAQSRYCDTCRKQVHDLTARTGREAEVLLASEPHPCVRVVRDRCGRVVTADRQLLRIWPARLRCMYRVWAAIAFMLMGCKQTWMGVVPQDYDAAIKAVADPDNGLRKLEETDAGDSSAPTGR